MENFTERRLAGLDYLHAVTALLQRVRAADPVKGQFEAADLNWWWADALPKDSMEQLFWFDEDERPAAAVILTQFRSRVQFDPIVMPDADPEQVRHVIERGIAHVAAAGFANVDLEVDRDDHVQQAILSENGFRREDDGLVEAWLSAAELPEVSPVAEGYRSTTRAETMERPHAMASRIGPNVEERLRQTPLYRPEFDVVVIADDGDGDDAARGLFWFDPVTSTGSVEPMRTEDEHQRKGLARHVLTTGVNLLAQAGAERIKIAFELANPGASKLYPDVGFVPAKYTEFWTGSVAGPASS